MRKQALAAALAACLAASAANAVSFFTQIVNFSGTADLNSAKGVTSNAGAAPFFLFDRTVGTLNSVELSSSYGFISTVNVASGGTATGSVDTRSAARFSADNSAVTQVLNTAVNKLASSGTIGGRTLAPAAYDLVGGSSNYATSANVPFIGTSQASADMPTITLTDAASLAAFSTVGTASYNILLTTLTGTEVTQRTGSASASSATTVNGRLTVVYNVTLLDTVPSGTNVPEPATWAMMVAGFGLVGAGLRRQRRAAALA